MGKSGWTSALASALGWAGSSKIGVYPVSLGANREPMEFWSSFYALGCLTAYAKVHRDGELLDRFAFGRITPVQGREVPALVDGFPRQPGIFLLSHYVWNHQVNCDFAERIKRRAPGSLVIVGGPHIPRDPAACEKYFAAHPYVDAAVRHEGEVTLAELLRTIAESGVEPSDLARADLSAVRGTDRPAERPPGAHAGSRAHDGPGHLPVAVHHRRVRPLGGRQVLPADRNQPRLPLRLHVLRLGRRDAGEDRPAERRTRVRRSGVRGEAPDPARWGSATPTSASCRATSTSRASSSR